MNRHLHLVPPPGSDPAGRRASALSRLRALEAEHGDLRQLLAADHEAAAALYGGGGLERAVSRLEELATGRATPCGCTCGPS